MGKGSAPRPKSVKEDVFSANWALIFGQGETQPQEFNSERRESDSEGQGQAEGRSE